MKKIMVLLLMGLFFFGCLEQDENKIQNEIILNSIEKQINLTDTYHITYLERVSGIDLNIEILKNKENSAVITESEIDKKWIYLKEDGNFMCSKRKTDEKIICTEITNDVRFSSEINNAKSRFVNQKITADAKNTFEVLIGEKVLDHKIEPLIRDIGGRECTQLEFMIYYSDMTVQGLTKIGLSSTNPLVNKYKNFTQSVCYDNEFGIPLYIKLSYIENNKEVIFERTVIDFSESVDEIEVIEELEEMNTFYNYYALAVNELNGFATCKNSDDSDSCFRTLAFQFENSNFCDYITDELKRHSCLIISITYDKNPQLCERINTIEDRDACYLELTRNSGDKTYCNYIKNEEVEEMCLELNVSLPVNIVECETNEDCSIQGCNHEVCAPVNSEIMTNCEWKDVYSCYSEELTSCKCIDGRCMWEVTSELIDCIHEYEWRETLIDIKNRSLTEEIEENGSTQE